MGEPMADGFLGRWSQRKRDVASGKAVGEPPPVVPAPSQSQQVQAKPEGKLSETPNQATAPSPPAPTLEEAQALNAQSDYKPFMANNVSPEVKNLAMKKLFADPHFNIMDGLDIYIDDYSQPNPLPIELMRKMTSAKFLNLFDEKEEQIKQPPAQGIGDDTGGQPLESVAQSSALPPTVPAADAQDNQDHAHTDLRLQQDDAAGAQGSERLSQ